MSSHHSRHETPLSSSATPHQKQQQPTNIDDISKIAIKNERDNEENDDQSTFSSPSLNPSRSSSTTSSLFAAHQLQIKKFASQKTTSEYDSENLPKQLQCGATRYLLIELGEGNGGQVYVPSLALQKRPLPMQHTWRPRYDSEKKAMFFVNLHDRGKLWQLPDVQDQLSSAVEHHRDHQHSQNNTKTDASSTHHRYPEEVKENRSALLEEKRKQEVEDAIENSMTYKLINDLTAEETGKRRKLIDRERREFLEEYETFREDFNAMKKLQRVQLAVIEQKLREDIQKVMQNNVSKIAIKAEHKIHAKRRIAELLSLEAAERSDLRFAYDHELMELREDEVRGRLSAKMKTRETASDKFAHFERKSVEGAEEIQRNVLLQEEAVLRGKMFLTFSKLRLGGFLRLMKPEPGDPKWSPWSEEIRPENSFIASKEFGLFYDPPLGEAVHKAWHAKKNQPEFTGATDLLAAARVDAVALFGDFTLGLSELFRLFVRAMLCTAMNEIQQQSNSNTNDGGVGDRSASNNYNNTRRSVSQASSNSSISTTISSRVSSIHLDFDAPPSHIFTTIASSKFRWLDAQKAIDGTPMTDLFPSSFQRTKERQLIDVIATEKEWRDRSLANTLAIQQRRKEEAEYGDRMMRKQQQQQHPFVDRERDSEMRQVTQHDTAIGRHLRRFPNYSEMNNDKNTRSISREQYHHQNSYEAPAYTSPIAKNVNNNSKRDPSPTNRSNYNSHPHPTTTTSSSHFKTPQPNFTDPEELLFTSNRTPSKNHSSSASMLNSLKQREKDPHSTPSDIASERLELIRAIRSGQVLEDDTDAIYNPHKKDLSPSQKVQEKLSSLLSRSEQRHRNNNSNNTSNYSSRLDKDMDWSRFSKNNNNNNAPSDGGLRWDSKSSKGVTLAEEDSTAFFDINNPPPNKYSFNSNMPFRIAPAFAIGTVGVSRGLFIWQVKFHISNYQKYAGASPTFKIGMVSRFFASAMEKASQRNSVLAGMIASRDDGSSSSSSTLRTKSEMINETKAMSYWYDEKGSLWCGADAMELTEVAKGFGPNLNTESSMLAQGGTSSCHVTVVLDFDKWLIQFFVNGRSTGVAFRFNRSENGGDPEPLFPCILFSSVGDEVTLMPPDDAVLSALSLDE